MIVAEVGDQLVLVRLTDHALLSGWLAAVWGASPWSVPEPYHELVVAARLHDLAWSAFDETLPLRADGRPAGFAEIERGVRLRLYVAGIDAVEAIEPYAGLLDSLHYSGFFASHWGWPLTNRLEGADAAERAAVERFLAHEEARRRRLRERLGAGVADEGRLRCGYVWLQLWDRISLDVCRRGFTGWSNEYPPAPVGPAEGAAEVRLRMELRPGGVCLLDPYPLLVEPYHARVPAVRVPRSADPAELRRAWLARGDGGVDVTFRALR